LEEQGDHQQWRVQEILRQSQYLFQGIGLEGLTRFGSILWAGNLDIDEVNLEFFLGLNSD